MVEWGEFFRLSVSDPLGEALLCAIPFYSHSQLRVWQADLEKSFKETPALALSIVLARNALTVEIEWRDELQAAVGLWEEAMRMNLNEMFDAAETQLQGEQVLSMEFDLTTDANRENEDADKLRLFPALLKKRASKCSSSDSEDEKRAHRCRKDKKRKKKSTRSRDSSSDDSSSSESEDEVQRHRKKEKHHKKPERKDPIDQLVKEMAELKVRLAASKEKRKDAMTLRHDLWCSLCGNQGHTKEDCRLPKSNQSAAANSHWMSEVPTSSTDDYYAEGADGHVYHVSMAGTSSGGPKFAPPRYNPPEYVGGSQGHLSLLGSLDPFPLIKWSVIDVQFVDVPSTSGTKVTTDVNVQTIGYDVLPTIAEEQQESRLSTSNITRTFDPSYIPVVPTESEGWPSDSKWMVNQVSMRSKKRDKFEELSTLKGKEKVTLQRKDSSTNSSTSELSAKAKSDSRKVCKDDISDIIRNVLKKIPPSKVQDIPSTSKEPPRVEARPPNTSPTSGRPLTMSKVINSSPICATMEYDLVEDLANTPANISMLQLILHGPQLFKGLNMWCRQNRLSRTSRGLRIMRPPKEKEVKAMQVMLDKGAQEIEIEIRGCIIQKVPLDTGSEVNIMTARTAQRLGLTDLQPCKKFLRLVDQSRKQPLSELKNIETIMDGVAFQLDYIVLQPEDEQGYEVLIGRPWFYGAGMMEDWNCQEVCFQVEGRRKKVRIPWGPVSYHGEIPQEDSGELTFAESAYDSDHSSFGVYSSQWDDTGIDSSDFWSYYLEVYEASDEDLFAYSKEIKALSISGLEETASEEETLEFRGATIYNLGKSEDGTRLKELLNEPLAETEGEKQSALQGCVKKKCEGVLSRKEGKALTNDERSKSGRLTRSQIQALIAYVAISSSDEKKDWANSEKGGAIVCQKLNEVLNAPLSDKEPTNSEGEKVPHREDETMSDLKGILTELGTHRIDVRPDAIRYNQVFLRPEDCEKTTFTTDWGTFAYRVMPFGLTNAPATFQPMMTNIFRDYLRKFVEVFLDDFCVYSSKKDHMEKLGLTFEKCRASNLRLHPEKSYICMEEGILLGHRISCRGIEVDKEKVAIIVELKPPRCVRDVRAFLGSTDYYRRFVWKYPERASPLTQLLKKDIPWKWGETQQEAFEDLKLQLVKAVLIVSNWERSFHVYVDTSAFAIGVVLSQQDEEKHDHPIYFSGKKLTDAERKFSTTEREALGMVFKVKKFRHYLLGYEVVFHVDHYSLKYLVKKADFFGRIARWVLLLQEFNNTVKWQRDSQHANADYLSRLQ
ncbi:hypothetical protein R1flu_004626 [Riccia fluitans]|uniref:RNA-directed DNA polymerase n=1 Tax=Riccia fluitans TaxID=41844 RepID=A0ABD1YTX2_9MARC